MPKKPHSSESNKLSRNKIQAVFKPAIEWKASDDDFQDFPFSTKMSSVKRKNKLSVSGQAGSSFTSGVSTSPKSSSIGSKKPVSDTVFSSGASTSAISKRAMSVASADKSDFDSDSDVGGDDSIDDNDSDFGDGSYNRLDSDQLADKALKPNFIPLSIYTKYEGNLAALAFISLYGADGFNNEANHKTGLGFRSTSFPHMYRILKHVGVSEPRLKFQKHSSNIAKEKAGYTALVVWIMHNEKIMLARRELELPSSRIHNTIVPKASRFIFSLSKVELMVFVLFWLAGDGHVLPYHKYTKETGSLLSFSSMEIASRDEEILKLMKAALERYGFTEISIYDYKTCVAKLKIRKTPEMNKAVLEALNTLSPELLHPKHKYWILYRAPPFLTQHPFLLPIVIAKLQWVVSITLQYQASVSLFLHQHVSYNVGCA
ncbi:hypothetical protein PS15m_006260 [Mucor circinelloides]